MVRQQQLGFTLIELMIVVAIIAILAAIAYPSYQEYVKRTHRLDTQAEMMEIAARLQRYKVVNFRFLRVDGVTPITLADINQANIIPSGMPRYGLVLSNVTANTWTLTATPVAAQIGDGHLVLNHQGERCWTKGSDKNAGSACVPSTTSNWDGR
ncbi:type IV pilin protein [Acinetobacter haemolyticus]|uniref:type IV pilin protein n=1 Tax=Acinetobacter haemolyticus TaxID=29430 RepID=UPI000F761E18|nr:prepilin-type N-terminal cleavage/methylation domain-containing protein [Acinetobacter haemolyticus]